MADEAARKAVALEYCRRMNSGDLDGVMELFASDVRFQDPVGTPPLVGRAAVRAHLARAVAAGIVEEPGTPTASLDGETVALPVSGTLDAPAETADGGRVRFNLVSLMRVDDAGLVVEVRVIAGRTDYGLVDPSGV
ncbi:nuclear transport factor 2 family protein [Streptomycetaceae bacterium NBC_01309]